jgi:lysozyme family protein
VLSDQVVGVVEQSPMAVVVAHSTGQTAAVLAEFAGGGQDEMIVVDQWAVLVHKLAAAKAGGTGSQGVATMPGQAAVYALSSNGTVLEHADLPGSGALAMAVAACLVPYGAGHKLPVSNASGSPGSGSVVPPVKHNGG